MGVRENTFAAVVGVVSMGTFGVFRFSGCFFEIDRRKNRSQETASPATLPDGIVMPSGELPYVAQRNADMEFVRGVENLTSAELREKIENDPAFVARYNNLPWDTKAACPALLRQLSLQEKARALGNDLFAFLREKGPEPNPQFNASMPFEDRL